jgi:ATP-dependent DNA helicase RecG
MTVESIEITLEEQDKILKEQEGHCFELKSVDISPAKLTETLSAFANATGGDLYVGVDEKVIRNKKVREWRGFPDQEAANGHIQTIEEYFPLGEYCGCTFIRCKNSKGLLLKVEVNKTRKIKRASNGIIYLRRGAQNLPVDTDDKIRRLRLNKGLDSYETELVNIGTDVIENSKIYSKFLAYLIPQADPVIWLRKQFLVMEEKPTVAAVLLFAEEPQAILSKHCGIQILRYQTRDKEGSRLFLSFNPISIEGCMYDSIREAVSKTIEVVEGIQRLGIFGLESVQYPPETLHEIITNAVLHRDYSIARDIQIRVFDNRIEVESPGRLPGHITEGNILREQFSRNGSIVRILNKFQDPPNKSVGEGLNAAFEAMTRLKLKAPVIKEKENSVIVYIRHEPLASPEQAVLQYLETHDEVINRKARELTGITSENSMKQVFYRLRSKRLVERVPDKRGASSAWRKVGLQPRLF